MGPGVFACGTITCTYYFSQSATKSIDQAIGGADGVAVQTAAAFRVCKGFEGEAEAYCTAGAILGTLFFADTVHSAAENDMCLAIKALLPNPVNNWAVIPTQVYANGSANCIS